MTQGMKKRTKKTENNYNKTLKQSEAWPWWDGCEFQPIQDMTSVQTSVGSLLWDMAEWDPGNEPRHRAKVRCCRNDERKRQSLISVQERTATLSIQSCC